MRCSAWSCRRDLDPDAFVRAAIPNASRKRRALTLKALAAEPGNATAHYCLGLILLFSRTPEQAIAELERALSLDRNLAFAHAQIGFAKAVLGRAEETEAHVLEAMRLSPRDTGAYVWCDFVGVAEIMLGRDAEALALVPEGGRNEPRLSDRALSLRRRARPLRADRRSRREAAEGLRLAPDFTVRRYRDAALSDNPTYLSQRARILEGMRLAGVPEG